MDMTNIIKVPNQGSFRELPLYENFRELVEGCAAEFGEEIAFVIKTKKATKESPAEYVEKSFIDFRDDIKNFGMGLVKLGLQGKRLAVISKNRYEWMVAYFAQLQGVGICVPLDKDLPYEEFALSLSRAEVSTIVFDKDHYSLIKQAKESGEFKDLKLILMEDTDEEGLISFNSIIELGAKSTEEEKEAFNNLPIDGKEMSIILFTSGTSGLAKAVMLSQYNITSNCKNTAECEDLRRGDVNIAFLPYHHTFGCTGQIMMTYTGVKTVYCDGLKYVQQNICEYKVSLFVCVPLLIESIYKRIMTTIKKQGKMDTFNKGIKISKFLLKFGIDVRRKLFKDIHEQLGGNLRYIISGASPLDPVVAEMFTAIGIQVVQGYGMTETSPVIVTEGYNLTSPGTIGQAIPRTEVVILNPNEEGVGELVAKGPGVMLGYYKDPEKTAETIEDGWIHTGDLAFLTKDNMIKICGRSKNVIVLKNGKNVYPEEIEALIVNLPYVKECMVFGEEKRADSGNSDLVIAVRVVYEESEFEGKELTEIEKLIKSDIEKINDQIPNYKRIANTYVTLEEMEKTTTGKVKRYKQINK